MKKTLLLLLCFPLMGFSQNGGQKAENESLRLEIVGSIGSKTIIKVTNKQNCTTDIKFYHDGVTDIKTFQPSASDTFQITLADCSIKAKSTTNCGNANIGWVEWNICVALPVKFEWIKNKVIDSHTVQVQFKLEEVDGTELYIQVSTDGLNFKRVLLVTKEMKVNQIYTTTIKL
jgi:hypothetical protein